MNTRAKEPAPSPLRFRVGIDIGGTFTDGVLIEEDSGKIWVDKVPTTPLDPSEGFLESLQRLASRASISSEQLEHIIHATTVATNAVLERRGGRVGLLVTQGFRDVLEIARQIRYELYNLQTEKPSPLVPRDRVFEIAERLDYRGAVIRPLDEQAVIKAVEGLRAQQVDSVAICFLHSYQNSTHEQQAASIVRRISPEMIISISSDIAPEIREYWRASTAAANAYIAPVVAKYLDAIEQKLIRTGIKASVQVVQSNGGIMSVAAAKQRPIYMLESGPAAGVTAVAYFAQLLGFRNAISFDMGGTTAKMGLILDGQPRVVSEFEAGGISGTGVGLARGSGYPILAPVIDLVEVGTGGGSIAWIDDGGLMRVGPRSAGASPGPACYGQGGDRPTVTDANLVLGRLNPDYFLGGEIRLHADLAQAAIRSHCGDRLGLDTLGTAMGIIDIANARMIEAMRLVSVQRGYDPRDFCLVAFGGAGPMHANVLADDLGIPFTVIPPSPGVVSALGMLASDPRVEYRMTRLQPLAQARLDELNAMFVDFERQALTRLIGGANRDDVTFERCLEMRYFGQAWKLKIPVPDGPLSDKNILQLQDRFHQAHERSYGYFVRGEPIEIVNISLTAVARVSKPQLRRVGEGDKSSVRAQKSIRPVYFRETGGLVDCPVFDRYQLLQGNVVMGPAVIEEVDSSTVVSPGYVAEVVSFGILTLRPAENRNV
jgi:N-methylhydantoinase A